MAEAEASVEELVSMIERGELGLRESASPPWIAIASLAVCRAALVGDEVRFAPPSQPPSIFVGDGRKFRMLSAWTVVRPSENSVWLAFFKLAEFFFKVIKLQSEAMEALEELRNTFLLRLLSGELSVSSVDKAVQHE